MSKYVLEPSRTGIVYKGMTVDVYLQRASHRFTGQVGTFVSTLSFLCSRKHEHRACQQILQRQRKEGSNIRQKKGNHRKTNFAIMLANVHNTRVLTGMSWLEPLEEKSWVCRSCPSHCRQCDSTYQNKWNPLPTAHKCTMRGLLWITQCCPI